MDFLISQRTAAMLQQPRCMDDLKQQGVAIKALEPVKGEMSSFTYAAAVSGRSAFHTGLPSARCWCMLACTRGLICLTAGSHVQLTAPAYHMQQSADLMYVLATPGLAHRLQREMLSCAGKDTFVMRVSAPFEVCLSPIVNINAAQDTPLLSALHSISAKLVESLPPKQQQYVSKGQPGNLQPQLPSLPGPSHQQAWNGHPPAHPSVHQAAKPRTMIHAYAPHSAFREPDQSHQPGPVPWGYSHPFYGPTPQPSFAVPTAAPLPSPPSSSPATPASLGCRVARVGRDHTADKSLCESCRRCMLAAWCAC